MQGERLLHSFIVRLIERARRMVVEVHDLGSGDRRSFASLEEASAYLHERLAAGPQRPRDPPPEPAAAPSSPPPPPSDKESP